MEQKDQVLGRKGGRLHGTKFAQVFMVNCLFSRHGLNTVDEEIPTIVGILSDW